MIKNFTLLLSFVLYAAILSAQSPRMLLVEEGTQASCPPCAGANPPLQALLNLNKENAIFIAYQTSWPGVDAMNEDNPQEVADRIAYYGINGVPDVALNGTVPIPYVGPAGVTQELIDETNAEMSDFDLALTAELKNGELQITGNATATSDVSGDLKLRIVLTEKVIKNADLPYLGTNGEVEFHHVMKKFIGGTEGITLAESWVAGDTYEINESFSVTSLNVYNFDQIEVVGFIQDDATKYVHQAARESEIAISTDFQNNVSGVSVGGFSSTVCEGTQTVTPTFNIVNTGNEDLTSADITYSVNGGAEQTDSWTGNLSTLAKETVTLSEISYEAEESNVISITVSSPNGLDDENESDNTLQSEEFNLLVGNGSITVDILTDDYGDEVYWQIANSAGDVIAYGGNPTVGMDNINTGNFPAPASSESYANATQYTTNVPVAIDDCYTFSITDYYGDGMSLSTVDAYFDVQSSDGIQLALGIRHSTAIENATFQENFVLSSVESIDIEAAKVFPNPFVDVTNVSFTLLKKANCSIIVTDALGRVLQQKSLGNISSGEYAEQVDLTEYQSGIYFINIKAGNSSMMTKVTHAK